MRIFSARELAFLRNPDRFNERYQTVLRCRIRKKVRALREALWVIETYYETIFPNGRTEEYSMPMLN